MNECLACLHRCILCSGIVRVCVCVIVVMADACMCLNMNVCVPVWTQCFACAAIERSYGLCPVSILVLLLAPECMATPAGTGTITPPPPPPPPSPPLAGSHNAQSLSGSTQHPEADAPTLLSVSHIYQHPEVQEVWNKLSVVGSYVQLMALFMRNKCERTTTETQHLSVWAQIFCEIAPGWKFVHCPVHCCCKERKNTITIKHLTCLIHAHHVILLFTVCAYVEKCRLSQS